MSRHKHASRQTREVIWASDVACHCPNSTRRNTIRSSIRVGSNRARPVRRWPSRRAPARRQLVIGTDFLPSCDRAKIQFESPIGLGPHRTPAQCLPEMPPRILRKAEPQSVRSPPNVRATTTKSWQFSTSNDPKGSIASSTGAGRNRAFPANSERLLI